MMRCLGILTSLALVAAACGPRAPDATPDTPVRTVAASEAYGSVIDSVRSLLRPIAERGVGIAVAVHRGDSALWVEGLGHADDAGRRPVDPDRTVFRVYSLTKAMTAAAGARLMEAGRLDPAATVQRYLPSFPEKARPVTVMGLATHEAGIRHYREGEARSRIPCATVHDALPIFTDDPLVPLDPGAEAYSSWGYVLLSAVLEVAAGEPFQELMTRLILDPAGMSRTRLDDPEAPPDLATPLTETEAGVVPEEPVDNRCKWGSGAYLATAPDLARFGVSLFDGTLLAPPSAALLLQGREVYRAQGVGAGGTAFMLSHAPSGTSIVLLGNVSGETLGPALQAAFGVMVELFLSPSGAAKGQIRTLILRAPDARVVGGEQRDYARCLASLGVADQRYAVGPLPRDGVAELDSPARGNACARGPSEPPRRTPGRPTRLRRPRFGTSAPPPPDGRVREPDPQACVRRPSPRGGLRPPPGA